MKIRPLAKLLVKRPKTVILVFTIITIVIGLNIKNIYMQSDLSGFLPKDDPSLKLLSRIYKEFDVKSSIIIYVEADDIRDPVVLKEMDRVSSSINTYENDRGEQDDIYSVQSLASLIKAENSKAYVIGGLGGTGENEIPEDTGLISKYLARITIQETEGILYTNTYKDAVIIVQLADGADFDEVLARTKDAIDHRGTDYSEMAITGTVAMQKATQAKSFESLKIVFPLAALFVAIDLFFFHRSLKGFIIGFLPLTYALILTFGILGIVQPQLSILTVAVAALLLGFGIDYSIYYANRYAEEHDVEDKVTRVERTLGLTGKAVLMCALTTIVGFGSLMTSSMPPMVTFGFACAIGISFAFLSATIMVPCLCLILKFEKHETNHHWKRFASFVVGNRKRLFVVACFFAILSLIMIPQIKTDVNFLEMAPTGIPEVETLLKYSENFGGGTNFNALLIETDNQGLTYPEVIEAIYNMEVKMREDGASVRSIADEIKKANDVLERNQIMEKISSYLGIEKIIFDKVAENGLVDKDFSKTIIVVTFPAGKSVQELEQFVNSINSIASSADIPHNGRVSQLVGQDVVTVDVNNQLMGSQVQSMITALLLVLACLILGFNSSLIGVIALIPVLFVLMWEPGALVMLNIPLSVVNITVASIMIGTGIDYSIQTTQRVREEIANGLSKVDALKTTIETSGWSVIGAATTTMVSLLATFAVNISVLHQFSIVIALLISSSFIAAIFILPTLLTSRLIK
jgi:uncharacterized protein